jgi:S4 domain
VASGGKGFSSLIEVLMALFVLRVEFWPTKRNGDVDLSAVPTLWFKEFNDLNKAMFKFMRMIPHMHQHRNDSKPCNLSGELSVVVDGKFTVLEEWDWFSVEARDNWSRSQAATDWINRVENQIPVTFISSATKLVDTLVACGLCSSNSDARRQIEQGAVRVNDIKVSDVNTVVTDSCTISKGKKHKAQITVQH